MNIAQIKQLDVGMAGIGCSGQVAWAGKSEHKTGTHNNEPYDFWSQFIVVADDTDKIGVQINNPPPNGIAKDDTVTIEKAKLKSYIDKEGKTVLKLQGKLAIDRPPQQAQQHPQQAARQPNSHQNGRDTSIERQAAFKAACHRFAGIDGLDEDIIELARAGHYFIETGNNITKIPEPDKEITNPGYVGDNPKPSPEDDIPF